MTCYYPLDAWRARTPNDKTGKYPAVFDRQLAQQDDPLRLPCRRCIGCHLDHARDLALRCVHEASLHEQNWFLTPTYSDDNLPGDFSISKPEMQNFVKRIRNSGLKIRYLAVGEYGNPENAKPGRYSHIDRPHYHMLAFGLRVDDARPYKKNKHGDYLYESKTILDLWGKGLCDLGPITKETAGYVARYNTKKLGGDDRDYSFIHPDTGDLINRESEFKLTSTCPGIGHDWYMKYHADLKKGYLTHNGKKHPIPRYYMDLMQRYHYEDYERITVNRKSKFDFYDPEFCNDRLRVREIIKKIRTKNVVRD